jgi:hypothetical protein
MVTSPRTWLAGSERFARNGFECVDKAPPSFELMVKRFDDAPLPRFPKNWAKRGREFGSGLTIVRTDQCPYIEDATRIIVEAAREKGIDAKVVPYEKSQRARDRSPSAFGVFGIVWDCELLSYHYLTKKQFVAAGRL